MSNFQQKSTFQLSWNYIGITAVVTTSIFQNAFIKNLAGKIYVGHI